MIYCRDFYLVLDVPMALSITHYSPGVGDIYGEAIN